MILSVFLALLLQDGNSLLQIVDSLEEFIICNHFESLPVRKAKHRKIPFVPSESYHNGGEHSTGMILEENNELEEPSPCQES